MAEGGASGEGRERVEGGWVMDGSKGEQCRVQMRWMQGKRVQIGEAAHWLEGRDIGWRQGEA